MNCSNDKMQEDNNNDAVVGLSDNLSEVKIGELEDLIFYI